MKTVDWQTIANIDAIILHLETICWEFNDFARDEPDIETARRISRYTPKIDTAIRTLQKMQKYYSQFE